MLPYRHDDTLSQFLKSLRKKRYWFVIVRVVEVLYGWELEGQQRASPYVWITHQKLIVIGPASNRSGLFRRSAIYSFVPIQSLKPPVEI